MKNIFAVLTAIIMLGISSLATASEGHDTWVLDKENSMISYGSIKKNSVGEVNHFTNFDASVLQSGEINLTIHLDSVETWDDTRNGRMKELLFQITGHPTASLKGKINLDEIKKLKEGNTLKTDAEFKFSLHGKEIDLDAEMLVIKLSPKKVIIIPQEMLFLDANDFELTKGLKMLQKLAGLPSISSAVPVTFYLTFTIHQTKLK